MKEPIFSDILRVARFSSDKHLEALDNRGSGKTFERPWENIILRVESINAKAIEPISLALAFLKRISSSPDATYIV